MRVLGEHVSNAFLAIRSRNPPRSCDHLPNTAAWPLIVKSLDRPPSASRTSSISNGNVRISTSAGLGPDPLAGFCQTSRFPPSSCRSWRRPRGSVLPRRGVVCGNLAGPSGSGGSPSFARASSCNQMPDWTF